MTSSRLPNEVVEQLTPLLGSLARLLAGGSQLSDGQLQTLLLGIDMAPNPEILDELKRWGRLLTGLRQQPTLELRLATTEALLLRGLPEATVLLAVATVAERSAQSSPVSVSPSTPRLRASVERLDFGTLTPGQSASKSFEVQGGPGQVVVENDQITVTPQQFGTEPTRLQVQVRGLASGVLWTTLRLVTPGETLDVSVLAQWAEEVSASRVQAHPTTRDGDLSALIEQAMGLTPSTGTSNTLSPSSAPPSSRSADEEEILRQMRRLLG